MKRLFLVLLVAIMAFQSHAQITEFPYTEGFEGETFPPTDWLGYPIVAGDMEFTRVTEGSWPECLPHDGSLAMAQYNSFNASAGEEAVLISPELILTDDNVVRFWFFRSEDPSNNRLDKIEVFYNSTPNLEGAMFLDSVNRAINFYPEVTTEDWYQYEFEFSSPGSTYIIFKAISAYGWKMHLDDVEINTNFIDVDPPEIISLEGNQVYAQQDMNLVLRVRDDSEMPETLNGFAFIDGQTLDIVMTKIIGAKGDFIYEGSLPGQTDHTEGEIQFYLVDEPGNTAWSDFFPLNWDWVQPILEEGFEGEVFPPEGWTVTGQPLTWFIWDDYGFVNYIDSDNVGWEITPPQGEKQAAVEWDFQQNVQNEWMISPVVSITENAVLTFKTFARLYSYDYDEYLVNVSLDGFNWEPVWSAADYEPGVSNYDEDISVSLENYVGCDIRVAWQAYNLMGTNLWYSWFVDDIKIRASDTIVGIHETQNSFTSRAFPNPFTEIVHVQFEMNQPGNVSLEVFSLDGASILKKEATWFTKGQNHFTIDGKNLPSGFYFFELQTKNGTSTGKLIRQ